MVWLWYGYGYDMGMIPIMVLPTRNHSLHIATCTAKCAASCFALLPFCNILGSQMQKTVFSDEAMNMMCVLHGMHMGMIWR